MITHRDVMDMIGHLVIEISDSLVRRCEGKLASGALDLEAYEDNYRLPKILVSSVLAELADHYQPPDKEARRTVKNLSHF